MPKFIPHQVETLLKLIRAEEIEKLAAQISAMPALDQIVKPELSSTPRERGLLVKQLIEQAIQSLKPVERDHDSRVRRAYTLLTAFYAQHKNRRDTLALMQVAGGSFDRAKVYAIARLTDALNQLAAPARAVGGNVSLASAAARKRRHLPYRPYRVLWGRETEADEILNWLTRTNAHAVVCISGMGGNGKTALARHIAEAWCTLPTMADALWVSAKREALVGAQIHSAHVEQLTFANCIDQLIFQTGRAEVAHKPLAEKILALTNLLREQTHLIVLDNLDECQNEVAFTQQVLNILGTSRLLITSRHQHTDALPVVRPAHLGGLREEDSIQLLRAESAFSNLDEITRATPETMRDIHAYTGGAPLALHLVIGQAHAWPLATVLAHLRQARELDTEFYTFLFKQDWLSLSDAAQRILIYIGRMIRTSVTHAQLRHTRIVKSDVDAALEMLIQFSLLETNGALLETEKRYSLHPLVRHFVVSELPKLWTSPTT